MKTDIIKLYSHRLRNLRVMVKLLRLAPYVRCVILNGSMATGNIKESSDIDILIISQSGRIYTCRAAILFWATLTGLKRSSNEKKSYAGKFCFNYFLTDNFLTIPHNRGEKVDKYCAENYSKSILLWGDNQFFERFMNINLTWMKRYLPSVRHPALPSGPRLCPAETGDAGSTNSSGSISEFPIESGMTNREKSIIQKFIDRLLSDKFGNRLEHTLKKIQIARIKKDPAVKKYPKFIVFNDKELRFHYPKTR